MKRLVLALACAAALVGCGDGVSGKYAGKWENRGGTYTITDKGDHYDTFRDLRNFGKESFITKEDADGYLVFDTPGNKRLFKIIDANTIASPSGNSVYTRVK
ncbi:MAG: hypothetical protein ACRC9N_11265 [Aeromonas sp.]